MQIRLLHVRAALTLPDLAGNGTDLLSEPVGLEAPAGTEMIYEKQFFESEWLSFYKNN